MSSPPLQLPPVPVQESIIESALNGTLITNFLAGLYSLIYFSTLYLYCIGKSVQRRRLVICIITVLYVAYLLDFIGQWYLLKITVVNQGVTRGRLFIAVADSPGWGNIINNISSFLLSTFADTLLIWRCFHAWDGSMLVVVLPLLLLLVEVALNLFVIVKSSIEHWSPSPPEARILNEFIAAGLFTTFACTVSTTLLIIYRIYPVVYGEGISRTGTHRFKHVLDILIQSSALYCLASLAYAISSVLPLDNTVNTALVSAQIYSASIFLFIAGAAPTVMVARVCLAIPEGLTVSKLTHVSRLQFNERSTSRDHAQFFNSGSSDPEMRGRQSTP